MEATVTGLDALKDLAAVRPASAQDEADRLLDELARTFADEARRFAPKDSGDLRSGITATRNSAGILAQAAAPYAVHVLTGVSAQYMTWLLGKTVSFIARDGEKVTRRVTFVGERNGRRHWYRPATPPQDFFLEAWQSGAVQQLADALRSLGVEVGVAFLYGGGTA